VCSKDSCRDHRLCRKAEYLQLIISVVRRVRTTTQNSKRHAQTNTHTGPVDCDFFFHMNNCMYFRHAELARWELLPRTGILQAAVKHKWMFLVVSQDADYLLPLPPLTKFKIQTTATTDETNKYMYFAHDFISESGDTLYCTANVKAIVKEMSGKTKGKTVRPKQIQSITKEVHWLSSSSSSSSLEEQ